MTGCSRVAYYQTGLCSAHYQRKLKYGDPDADRPVVVKGDRGRRYHDRDGYILLNGMQGDPLVTRTGGRIYEHQYVVAQRLGRPLLPHENVHHVNGVRDDNRIENLELWSKSQPTGQRISDKVAWAKEIIETYGSDEERWRDV